MDTQVLHWLRQMNAHHMPQPKGMIRFFHPGSRREKGLAWFMLFFISGNQINQTSYWHNETSTQEQVSHEKALWQANQKKSP